MTMKIVITGAAREGKTLLLQKIRHRVLESSGNECHILDGGVEVDHIPGGPPMIKVFVTNHTEEAVDFLTKED